MTALEIVITIVVSIGIYFLLNKILPYKKRAYRLDNTGVKVAKGKKKKHFSWNEFECFYPYRSYQTAPKYKNRSGEAEKEKLLEANLQMEGRIFYLQKKREGLLSKLFKTFVVVRAEPDNSKAVMRFLSKRLLQKKMTSASDLGLVVYKFK